MESPATAQETLLLHGFKTGNEGFGMNVLISDPSAKAQRTDASTSTIFIGGLNPKTTEEDVRGLLQGRGTIRHLKLGWDPVKQICKGFAFVEMASETEAKACLPLDSSLFQKRNLKVQISDPNHANKKTQDRLVRLFNLPENCQEGLLQQELEKIVPVKRLEVFARVHEAVAELLSAQDAGKLLLRNEPFEYDGQLIHFSTQDGRPPAASGPKADEITTTSFAPRAARKGKVLAKPRPTAVAAAVSTAAAMKDGSALVARGQDDFRALVASTNKQREDKLLSAKDGVAGEKRKAEHEENDEVKRSRP
ncbi:uncharacterized protein IL334_004983 [Kwoniella shivajii]|uniref:RRM domain-containing protein n=1 Tax=Kwoniella shivajii TaxID=564305 RepID=A0ABZ1D2G0_9TREE|nr:hypothetical protein IL334_004983 [Kwoniella shivajii]